MKLYKRYAFTLAEVVVTLAIIGAVMAFTIGSVIKEYKEKQTVAAVKKFYLEISNAYDNAVLKNGSPERWGWKDKSQIASAERVLDILAPYLRVKERCQYNADEESSGTCFGDAIYKTVNKKVNWFAENPSTGGSRAQSHWKKYITVKLDNGFLVWFHSTEVGCNGNVGTTKALQHRCGAVGVDINGYKPPNALGRDTFYFWITKYGIIPIGTKEDTTYKNLNKYCSLTSNDTSNGYSCTAWIIAKGNMDYLKKQVKW